MIAFNFDEMAVAVTGAGSGIGLAIAQAFHAAGALGVRVFCGVLDVRDASSVAAFFAGAERDLGHDA